MNYLKYVFLLFCIMLACNNKSYVIQVKEEKVIADKEAKLYAIPASTQREGDPVKGRKYLLEGDHLDSGIPLDFVENIPGFFTSENVLGRSGINAKISPEFTVTKAPNGVEILSPNCLQCHGAYLNDEYVLGLGNHSFDGTLNQGFIAQSLGFLIKGKYSENSLEWEAFEQFYNAGGALNNQINTKVVGTNSADKITEVLLAHRRIPGFEWSENPLIKISEETIPIDPPAWWLLKKKNAQFTTGIGRGDFARISLASSLLTMKDTSKAMEIDQKFPDVVAFIKSIEAPKYPKPIDTRLANHGALIFKEKCSKCHGTYGAEPTYPNYLVHLDVIKSDSRLAHSYHERIEYVNLYNESWFGKGENGARIVPGYGYVAPPLDGVWATAPYLHNGSVPNIRAMLDSKFRPQYWRRSFNPKDYDWVNLGWNYVEKESKIDKYTYDTTIAGYTNQGHYFGDKLSEDERDGVLEYLKTL